MNTLVSKTVTGRYHLNPEHRGLACGLVSALIWGGYLAVSRQGIASGLDPVDLSFLRYTTAAILLLPWLLHHKPFRLAGIGWRRSIILTILAGPPFVLVGASGFLFAPLAHGAVIQLGMLTVSGALLAYLLIGEKSTVKRVFALVIVCLGLIIIAGPGLYNADGSAWIGDMLFASAGTMWALFTVLQRRWGIAPMATTAVVSVLSGMTIVPFYLATRGFSVLASVPTSLIVEQIVVLGVMTGVVALLAFSQAVADLGAGRAALFPAFAPGVAILLGVPLTSEMPDLSQLCGLIVLSGGLILATRHASR